MHLGLLELKVTAGKENLKNRPMGHEMGTELV
jgi:hypothetical protein